MDDRDLKQEPDNKEPVVYASPMKRLWAWVGVVYMVILVLLNTWALAHGSFLTGIGPLMVAPGLAGLGASAILLHREGKGRGGIVACVLVSGACFGVAAWNLIRGVPVLWAQLWR